MGTKFGQTVVLTVFIVAAVTGCSSGGGSGSANTSAPAPSTPAVASSAPVESTSPAEVTTTSAPPPAPSTSAALYPHGYPKVVPVASLPYQVQNWYQMGNYTKAVAVAPGVWTPIPPGATMQDALDAGIFDGFCASVKAYERKYLAGQDEAGTCW